jgi:type II secretory pathway pseudopilin PulG
MSLIEIMVAMMLLSVLMLGLYSAFYNSQRALRMSANQTDILEGARSTTSLVLHDLQQVTASGQEGVVNFALTNQPGAVPIPQIGSSPLPTRLDECYFLTRNNDEWTGIGYFVVVQGEGVGTLYRFTESTFGANPPNNRLAGLYEAFLRATPESNTVGRVTEGLVHFSLRAYDTHGVEYAATPLAPGSQAYFCQAAPGFPTNTLPLVASEITLTARNGYVFAHAKLPAWIELEMGFVDQQVYRQFKAINESSSVGTAGADFLRRQAGKIHLFRQRIPLRNHHEP